MADPNSLPVYDKKVRGNEVVIAGYPGKVNNKENKAPYMYSHQGKIDEIEFTKGYGLVIYKDIDTSQGQSGAPLLMKQDNQYLQIGVHCAGMPDESEEELKNYGALFT